MRRQMVTTMYNNESYFPLPIADSFIETIISYSMQQFI